MADVVGRAIVMFIAFIICLGTVGFTIYESVQQTRLVFFGIRTDATVTKIEQTGIRSRTTTTTLRFTTEAQSVIITKDISGTGRREVNDIVPIVYLPSNPEMVAAQGMRGFEFLFLAIGIAFVSGLVFVKFYL